MITDKKKKFSYLKSTYTQILHSCQFGQFKDHLDSVQVRENHPFIKLHSVNCKELFKHLWPLYSEVTSDDFKTLPTNSNKDFLYVIFESSTIINWQVSISKHSF